MSHNLLVYYVYDTISKSEAYIPPSLLCCYQNGNYFSFIVFQKFLGCLLCR